MSADRPELLEIRGNNIRIEPLTRDRVIELLPAISHPIIFNEGFGGGPEAYREDEDGFVEWGLEHFQFDESNPYLVLVQHGPLRDRVIGTTTLGDFDLKNERAQIGWTAFDPRVWGSVANLESKLILLDLAFSCGFGRIEIQTDIQNKRSQAALQSMGASYEGTVRRYRKWADGTWRDIAIFSIILDDWPRVKRTILEKIAEYEDPTIEYREVVD